MKGKKKVLGRGLDALLGQNNDENILETKIAKENKFSEILLSKISSNPFQPRKSFKKETIIELANSIKSQGIIQPITVRKINNNKYRLLAGPFENFNALKTTYISLNNLGFEDLNIYKE